MRGVCGNHHPWGTRGTAHTGRGVTPWAVACAVALFAAQPAFAAGGGTTTRSPRPQELWRHYPLNPKPEAAQHHGSAATKHRPPAATPPVSTEELHPALTMLAAKPHLRHRAPARGSQVFAVSTGSSSGWSLLWPFGVIAFAGGLAAAALFFLWRSRRVRPRVQRTERARPAPVPPAPPPARAPVPVADEPIGREAAVAHPATSEAARERRAAPEVAVLKRKGVAGDGGTATRLKEKTGRAARPAAAPNEIDVLKAKLASSRPVCRIEWSRGNGKSTFCAKHTEPDGSWSVLERSRPFRWSKAKPPPKELPHVAEAYEALVARLKERGWVATRCRGDWFAVEMERRPPETARSAGKGET